ncbi:MAG: hypothetical protein HDS53_04025 [Barnesiella sp.]|nr:hypothetical protein [Barnesiella sp.]
MRSRFLSLYQMVLADGIIDAAEMETLFRIGQENYGITSNQINELIRDTDTSISYPDTLEDKVRFLYELAEIAWADGSIDNSELRLLEKYIVNMGFEESNSKAIANFMLNEVKDKVTVEEVIKKIDE